MRLLERIAALLKADAHGVVESLEERSLLLKQCLREIESEIDDNRHHLRGLQEEAKVYCDARASEEDAIAKLDEDIALAMSENKEDLARFVIRKLLAHRRSITEKTKRIDALVEQIDALAKVIDDQEEKLEGLRQRARAETEAPCRPLTAFATPLADAAIADEEVEIELMRRRESGGAA